MIVCHKNSITSKDAQTRLEQLGKLNELLFFDIETTGFHRVYDHLISITLMHFENNSWKITQLFAESQEDEVDLLNYAKTIFDLKKMHITYNGNAFDVPFLNIKYNYYNILTSLNKSKSYDLYRIAKKALNLSSYKLKFIEQHLGIDRQDQISGLECIENYNHYLSTKDYKFANLILDHNYEDVLNLLELSRVIDYLNPETFADFKIHYFMRSEKLYYFESVLLKADYLEIRLWTPPHELSQNEMQSHKALNLYYENGAQFIENSPTELYIKLPIYRKEVAENELILLDYETFNMIKLDMLSSAPQQYILKFNTFYLYENIENIIHLLLDDLN